MSDLLEIFKFAHYGMKSNLDDEIDSLKHNFDGGYEQRRAEKLIGDYIKEQHNIDVRVILSPNSESLDLTFSDIDDYSIKIEEQNGEGLTIYAHDATALESKVVTEIDEACRRYVAENGEKNKNKGG